MDLLGDLFVLGLILLSLWTFIPKHVREAFSSGAGPAIHALADMFRQVGRAGERLAYQVVVGHPREQPAPDYGKQTEQGAALPSPSPQHCATPETRNNGVATGETERNLLLRQGQAKALAKLIEAGKVSETEGLKIVYGVSPGSSQAYRDVRALLKEAQAPEYPALTADGRPVARALRTSAK